MSPKIERLSERAPSVSAEQLLEGFRPSERFGEVSFDTYRPDPSQPSSSCSAETDGARSDRRSILGLTKDLFRCYR